MVQYQLKLNLTKRQERRLNEWLPILAAVWNWAIRKIELDAKDGIYYSERHYLQSAPPGFVHLLEFIEGKDRVGGMIIGRPSAKTYNPDRILQLHRVWFVDETEHCAESKALALMRKHIRTWLPQIRLLLSYSDPSVGHEGTIYEADGWAPLGLTDEAWGYGWNSRNGRRDQKVSRKMRWVRTP